MVNVKAPTYKALIGNHRPRVGDLVFIYDCVPVSKKSYQFSYGEDTKTIEGDDTYLEDAYNGIVVEVGSNMVKVFSPVYPELETVYNNTVEEDYMWRSTENKMLMWLKETTLENHLNLS